MKRALILLLSVALVATAAEAGSKKKVRKTTTTHQVTRHAVVGAPVAHRGPARQEHGHGHAAQPQWPIPHTGPTIPGPLEQKPLTYDDHHVGHGSYDELGHWIVHH